MIIQLKMIYIETGCFAYSHNIGYSSPPCDFSCHVGIRNPGSTFRPLESDTASQQEDEKVKQ